MNPGTREIRLIGGVAITAAAAIWLIAITMGSSTTHSGLGTQMDQRHDSLSELVTSISLEHTRLLKATSQYVNGIGTHTNRDLANMARRYGERFSLLRPHQIAITSHATAGTVAREASLIVDYRQSSGINNYSTLANYHTDALAKKYIDSIYHRVDAAIETLHHDGKPTLVYVQTLLGWLQPGDFSEHFSIRSILDALNDDINKLEIASLEHAEHLTALREAQEHTLSNQLHIAYVLMALGITLLLGLLASYMRHKYRSTRELRESNARLSQEIEASARLTQALQHRATHDDLSGLLNRTGFQTALDELLQSGAGSHGLCYLDLDRVKIVNDSGGHAAGDALIKVVADTLTATVPDNILLARFGGDEFLILAPNCEPDYFRQVVKQCCETLAPLNFHYEGRRYAITGSFGALLFEPKDHTSHSVMTTVDAACYQAKRAGGARICFHHNDNSALAARQLDLQWVQAIVDALAQQRFRLYHQPISRIDPTLGKPIHSWEILVRMLDSNGEVLMPGKFLDVAERYGLASKVDRWVVTNTFAWLNANRDQLEQFDCININLSGRSIGDTQFLEFLESQTASLKVPTDRVCFEVTETSIAGDNAHAAVQRLRELAYQVALDDFGSGFSSFGYLEALPVDYIKIDGMFVRDIDHNPIHREFVKAINSVGKAMGKQIVAEFVENEASLQILHDLGVEFAQGYYIAKPAPLPKSLTSDTSWQKAA
jgi:diguanylate cyclase (GGDEF)-like protein